MPAPHVRRIALAGVLVVLLVLLFSCAVAREDGGSDCNGAALVAAERPAPPRPAPARPRVPMHKAPAPRVSKAPHAAATRTVTARPHKHGHGHHGGLDVDLDVCG